MKNDKKSHGRDGAVRNENGLQERKKRITDRIKKARCRPDGTMVSHQAIAKAAGTNRQLVGEVCRGNTDYRIESLIAVLVGLERLELLPDPVEQVLFTSDSFEANLYKKLIQVLRRGASEDRSLVLAQIERAAAGMEEPTARSGTLNGKSQRSA